MSSHDKSDFVRLCMMCAMIGFTVASVFILVLLSFDVLGIANLLTSAAGLLALCGLWVLNGAAFSVLQFIISAAGHDDDDDDHDGGHFAREYLAEPVLIRIEKDNRPRR